MAGFGDDVDYDNDDDYGFDEDYIYAEDSWALADELAANALPHPQYELEYDDYDMYNYWEELEYGNDDVLDGEISDEEDQVGAKRKRGKSIASGKANKRTRKIDESMDYPTVLWISRHEAFSLDRDDPVLSSKLKPYALFADWRERLKESHGFAPAAPTENPSEQDEDMDDEEAGDWEDMSHKSGDEESEEELDPDFLKTALAAKLSSSGLGDADQAAFMETLMQMLSGGENQDDMIESLTKTLLEQVSQGGADSSATQWLSQQGVSLAEEDDEDDAEDAEDAGEDVDAIHPSVKIVSTNPSSKDSINIKASSNTTVPTPAPAKDAPHAAVPTTAPTSRKRKQPAPTPIPQIPEAQDAELPPESVPNNNNKRIKRSDIPTAQSPIQAKSAETNDHDTKPPTSLSEPKPKETRKRKAAADDVTEQPARKTRSFAAPTASSQRKVSEPGGRTTRSSKQRK